MRTDTPLERAVSWLLTRFEKATNGGRAWDLNDYAVGCFVLQIGLPVLAVGLVIGAACGRLVR